MRTALCLVFILLLAPRAAGAQHVAARSSMEPQQAADEQEPAPEPHEEHGSPGEEAAHPSAAPAGDEHERMEAAMTMPLGLPLGQMGSGTSWQPPSAPMFGHMALVGSWALMLHYNAFAGLDVQGTPRGSVEWPVIGWVMGMARGPLLGGQLTARAMLSPEPLILGRRGYSLLLQTGETAFGEPLVDRQHPHDLFMELGLLYQRALGEELALELYLAPSGEPALGPTAYPHRLSALTEPLAPLSHHWQDSSHITFGVLTAGLFTRWGKLEVSFFNGVEPDEARLGLDLKLPDSVSLRATAIPGKNWALQASWGFLGEPELREPGASVQRYTASASYLRPLSGENFWSASLVWGANLSAELGFTHSLLLEGSVWLSDNVLFGRAEYIQKSAHDFALEALPEDFRLPVGSLVLGYVRTFGPFAGLVPGIGVRGAINVVGDVLAPLYESRFPMGAMVFVYLRPEQMMRGMRHGR